MPVYVLQEGTSTIYKIGLTGSSDIESRRRNLNSGNSAGLRHFRVIETDQPARLEKFLHGLLAHRNVQRHGGTEFFEMESENHMLQFLAYAMPMFLRHLSSREALSDLETAENSGTMIRAAASDMERLEKLSEIQARLRELDDEAVFLRFEKDMLENELKARIGCSPGIEGIATWESKTTRRFCLPLFIEREPAIYDHVLRRFSKLDLDTWRQREPDLHEEVTNRFPALDTTAWIGGDKTLYKRMQNTYFTPSVKRSFILL
jgi:hypothetical protein